MLKLSTSGCNSSQQNCTSAINEQVSSTTVQGTYDTGTSDRPFLDSIIIIEDAPQEVKDLVRSKEDIVLIMANKAEEAFKLRHRLMKECSCVPNRCANVLGEDATCGLELGNSPNECGAQQGTMYSMERGTAGMPQADQFPGNLADGLKASICLMNHLEKEAVPQLKQKNVTSWAYIGTEQGAIYSYPGRLRGRSNETGIEQWNFCKPYDPRQRPWYHEGATGPLDIVIVVDVSESMNDVVVGSLNRWDIVQQALIKFVDTLTFSDFFNIVFFNYEGSSLTTGLLAGSSENRQKAKYFIANFFPGGGTNFEVAFESAFDALSNGIENGLSTYCNKVILFLTDGKDNFVAIDKNRTRDIINKVEELQAKLESISRKRASIFSFSIGELADDSIPRQLACMHNGSWAPIAAQDDPLTVFNSFLKFIASARNTTRIYWSEEYEDASGLGKMISAVMPVYTPQQNVDVPGALFGVVSHDILVNDFKQLVGDQASEQIITILQEGSKQCDESQTNPCLQQVLRGEDVECVDLSYQNATCTKFDNKYYQRSNTLSTWSQARSMCQASGGQLAVPNVEAEQAFLAGMAAFEGSWIGLSNNGLSWVWEDAKNFSNGENLWGYGQGEAMSDEVECGAIAPSGTSKNVYSHACRFQFTHICEFENMQQECGDDFVDLDVPNYQFLMPRIQQCSSAESLDSIRFFDTVELPEILPEKLFCLDDFSSPSMTENFQALFCCPKI
eukprot:TRINITY_DN1659_c0_g1_i5.p1 TRINITY_DN1659_c0_g1~~TRINITY_DN1659_c0_g1_i5.p1  ORF type:complete len:805 (-),score=117.16 TRINITY_DN1659_c0_g1_i5:1192-3384(-)